MPPLRTNCGDPARKVALDGFQSELSGGLSQKLADAEAKVATLTASTQAAEATLAAAQGHLAALTKKRDAVDQEIGASKADQGRFWDPEGVAHARR